MSNVAIIGAGPAGLAAALRLHQQGITPTIFESVEELKPLGVGLDVKVYGSMEFEELGLLEEFRAMSVDAEQSIFYNKYGQEIYAELCGVHMGYTHEQRFVHRGELQMMLYRAVLERMGADVVKLGWRLEKYTNNADQTVTLDLINRSGEKDARTFDLVIAADGIKSVARQQMHPDHSEPVYSGITMWRGTTLMDPFNGGGTILHIGAPQLSSLIIYPIANNFEGTGKTLVNWVCEAERDESVEDWNQTGTVDQILPYYADTKIPFFNIQDMMKNAREVYLFPLIRHEPLQTWIDGRVILIGDAAHAMYPRGGNGACQSIVDGGALARHLATDATIDEALAGFEAERLTMVNNIVMSHRGEGYEVIRRMVEERTGGERFEDIEDVLPLAEADAIFSKYHSLVGQARPGHEAGDTTGFRTEYAQTAAR
ncbi:MAG: FAD-dependent monooxygenase [Arthrobacter sp.]|jgi:2-polyprenyl-6-methoxyphenol hydroxylase-like FAD-dependent oxidoreductase|nr:FAD-dependent monooxygenase [Arthrobacter sp.]